MVDHHVDRPDVEAQQCVKLTGTNRSIGLILCQDRKSETRSQKSEPWLLPSRAAANPEYGANARRETDQRPIHEYEQTPQSRTSEDPERLSGFWFLTFWLLSSGPSIDGLVATARGDPPDPIPNSAVKTLRADGTAS